MEQENESEYSEKRFHETYQLIKLQFNQNQYQKLLETIDKYVRMYIGTKNREECFEVFCEHEFVRICNEIIKKHNKPLVYIKIIQCLNMLSYNLKLDRQIVYFLSRPELNEIILYKNNEKQSESIDTFIQFLKSFAMRFKNTSYWKLFYNSKFPVFPLIWQTIKYFNSKDKLIRTTVRSIILQIAKIKNKLIEAYLNNFPFLSFLAYECCYIYDCIKQILDRFHQPRISESYIEDFMDQITFLGELCEQIPKQTRPLLFNSFIYYTIRPLWDFIINCHNDQEFRQKYSIIIFVLMNYVKDIKLKEIMFEIFFQKFISHPFEEFFNGKFRPLDSYPNIFKWEKCVNLVHQHASACYGQLNNQSMVVVTEQNLSIKSMIIDMQFKKSITKNFISKIPYIGNYTWDKWFSQELYRFSYGLGTSIERNKPTNAKYSQNIYQLIVEIDDEQKKKQYFKRTINPVFTKIQRCVESSTKCFEIWTDTYINLLNTSINQEIEEQIIKNYLEGSSVALYILQRNKCLVNIQRTVEVFEIIKLKSKHDHMLQYLSKQERKRITKQLNDIAKTSRQILESQIFEYGWNGLAEVFHEYEAQRSQPLQQIRLQSIHLHVFRKQAQNINNMHFYYLLRRVSHLLTTTPNEDSLRNIMQINSYKQQFNLEDRLSSMLLSADQNLVLNIQLFEYSLTRLDKVLMKGRLKQIITIKDIQQVTKVKLENQNAQHFQLEFIHREAKEKWCQELERKQKQIEALQIDCLIQLLQTYEQI